VFKQALFREYPNTRKPFISSADLGSFIDEKSKQEINALDEFTAFHQEFRRLATRLAKEKRVSANSLNRAYEKSIHPELQDKILFYLLDEKTPCIKGEAFVVKYVREGAKHILEGFDHQYKTSQPLISSRTSLVPPMKSEMSEVLSAIAMMGQKLQMVISGTSSTCTHQWRWVFSCL